MNAVGRNKSRSDAILFCAVRSVIITHTETWLERYKLFNLLGLRLRYCNSGPEWRELDLRPLTLCSKADFLLIRRVA
jgi:hypothetical protein